MLRSGFLSSEFALALLAAVAGYAIAAPEHAPWWRVASGVALAVIPVVSHAANRTALKQAQLETAAPPK